MYTSKFNMDPPPKELVVCRRFCPFPKIFRFHVRFRGCTLEVFGCFGCGISLVYEGFVSTCQAPAASGKICVVNLRYNLFHPLKHQHLITGWVQPTWARNLFKSTRRKPLEKTPDALPGRKGTYKFPCVLGARSAKKQQKKRGREWTTNK